MNAITLPFHRPNPEALRARRVSYYVLSHKAGEGFIEEEALPMITLDAGRLTVGSVPIHAARFTANRIAWIQQSPGRYSSGHIYLHNGGLSIHGVVNYGTTRSDAASFDFVGTAVKPVTYKTCITKTLYRNAQDPSNLPIIPASDWRDGLDLQISYQLKVGTTLPEPVVILGEQDITDQTTWSVSATGDTVLEIGLDDTACTLVGDSFYKKARLSFNPLTPTPMGEGAISALCGDASPTGGTYFWKTVSVSAAARPRPMPVERILPADITAVEGELSVRELMTILPDEQVNQDANEILIRNMKWAMGQDSNEKDWLSQFFGQTPPRLDPDEINIAKKSLTWYQNDFAKAYMTQAFQNYSGSNAPSHRLNDQQAKKLDDWFKIGLAKTADFTLQHNGIYVEAYRRVHTELDPYLQDGAEKWANALFDVLTSGAQYTLMVARVYGAAGNPDAFGPLNSFATLLTALDPSAKIASAYYKSVLTGVVQRAAPDSVHRDKEAILQWLPKAMEEMLRHFADGNIPDGVDISQQEAQRMLEDYLHHQGEIDTALADLLTSINATGLLKQIEVLEEKFAGTIVAKWPSLAKMVKVIFVVAWIGSIASILTALIRGDWKNMNDRQKAQFITQIAQTVFQSVDAVSLMYNGVKSITLKAWSKFTELTNTRKIQVDTENDITETLLDPDEDILEAVGEVMPEVIEDGAVETTLWARCFSAEAVAGIVKIFGAVAAVAIAGYSLWQLIDDIQKNGSVSSKVFDSLIFAFNFLAAAALVAALFITSTILPIAGALLAMAGVILSFILSFVEKPPNPVDDFMRNVGIPFVDSIVLPSSKVQPVAFSLAIAD
jgi:hypothetical protein